MRVQLKKRLHGKDRDMRRHDPPTFRQAYPSLALPARNSLSIYCALELQRDTAGVASKSHDVQPAHISRQVCGRTALSESGNLFDAKKIFRDSKARHVR